MMDRDSHYIQKLLVEQWNQFLAELPRLHAAVTVNPRDGFVLFRPKALADADAVGFEFQPVVFNLPERADDVKSDLFVVVRGRLSFRRQELRTRKTLLTHDFASQIGYFRRTATSLTHVYGAHYDLAVDEPGHPAFHAQMKSFSSFSNYISERYQVSRPVLDPVKDLIRTVRLPVAQMDVFSLFVQICADHLVSAKSGREERNAFNSLVQKGALYQGAGFQIATLGTDEARACYRARHWYPMVD